MKEEFRRGEVRVGVTAEDRALTRCRGCGDAAKRTQKSGVGGGGEEQDELVALDDL